MAIGIVLTCYEPAAREAMSLRLSGLGLNVSAPSQDGAYHLISTGRVDVVMVGPNADAREHRLLIAALETRPHLRIVVDLTAQSSEVGAAFVARLGHRRVALLTPPLSGLREVLSQLGALPGGGPRRNPDVS